MKIELTDAQAEQLVKIYLSGWPCQARTGAHLAEKGLVLLHHEIETHNKTTRAYVTTGIGDKIAAALIEEERRIRSQRLGAHVIEWFYKDRSERYAEHSTVEEAMRSAWDGYCKNSKCTETIIHGDEIYSRDAIIRYWGDRKWGEEEALA